MTFDWYWGRDIYMTGMGTIGLAVGRYQNTSRQSTNYAPTVDDNPATPIRNMKVVNTRPTFMAQMLFGPSYQKNFDNARMEIFLGYEFTLWSNLNDIYHSTAGAPSDTKETWINSSWTGLQGITFRVTTDF